jgi:RimJ/RimL family protein N-acetyltransferase
MLKYLAMLLILNFLNAADDMNDDSLRVVVVSPERTLVPERGCICESNFALLFMKPEYADSLATTYADPNVMKYLGTGATLSLDQVRARFSMRATMMFSEQNLKSYYWVVITQGRICGVVTAFATGTEGVLETSTLLSTNMQGKKLSKHLRDAVFRYLPGISWVATADPRNEPSWRSQESAGFVHQKTEYVASYNAFRKYYSRPSNDQLEGREVICFTYSGRRVTLANLLAE